MPSTTNLSAPYQRTWWWYILCAIVVSALVALLVATRRQDEGVTPLMRAASSGDSAAVRSHIAADADVNRQSRYGWTVLMFAAWQGHITSVQILLDAGADPNIESGSVPSQFETVLGHPPTTALREALRRGHIRIARELLDRGANVDSMAVAYAGNAGDIEFLAQLLAQGADLNQPSGNAFYASALCAAAANGDLKTVEWLVHEGAVPDLVAVGQTALKGAIEHDELDVVKYLLEHGADPNRIYGTEEASPLFTAATKHTYENAYPANLAIIETLLSHGANKNHRAYGGQDSALEFARIQRANFLQHITPDLERDARSWYEIRLAHMDAVIALLE